MTPAAGRRAGAGRGRFLAIVLLVAGVAGGGFLGTVAARGAPRTNLQPARLAVEAAPAGSASSSWYCPAAPGPAADVGTTELLLANAAGRAVRVSVVVVDERGSQRRETLELGPHAEADLVPGKVVDGAWLAARVEVAGGAVSATELVDGRPGPSAHSAHSAQSAQSARSVASCASEVSPRWYFASGSTRGGSTLRVSLFNPTPNLAVVDLSFVTSSGLTTPAPFQGLVVGPWTTRSLTVGAFVQNRASIATVVDARSGAVVAGELQLYGPAGAGGLTFALGAPATSTRWDLPDVEDASGGASELAVLNPSTRSEHVVVDVRLPSGPVQPFTQTLGPQSVWTLPTSQEPRIATQQHYTLQVRASVPGVVVARLGAGAPRGPAPWWAEDGAVTGLQTRVVRNWVVAGLPAAAPATTTATAARATSLGVATTALAFENPGRRALRVQVTSWVGARRRVQVVQVPALGVTTVVAPNGLALVHADGATAVIGDASPTGTVGVVAIPAVPER